MRNCKAGPVVAPLAFVVCKWISPVLGIVVGGVSLKNEGVARIVAKFDALEGVSVDVEKWKTYTNEYGALARGTSYFLMPIWICLRLHAARST